MRLQYCWAFTWCRVRADQTMKHLCRQYFSACCQQLLTSLSELQPCNPERPKRALNCCYITVTPHSSAASPCHWAFCGCSALSPTHKPHMNTQTWGPNTTLLNPWHMPHFHSDDKWQGRVTLRKASISQLFCLRENKKDKIAVRPSICWYGNPKALC